MKALNKRGVLGVLLIGMLVLRVGLVVLPRWQFYFTPYYTEEVYRQLENTFNRSQYRQQNPSALIPDEVVFSYAAGAYLHGIDPILVNSEHTPLGKYFIALSILFFGNDRLVILFFSLLTLYALWRLGKEVLGDGLIALIPVVIFSFEKLFLGQLIYVPLLDIIQLPFIFLALLFFMQEKKGNHFLLTALALGLVMATKTIVPALLLIISFILYFILRRVYRQLIYFLLHLPVTGGVLLFSYIKTFIDGYSLGDFWGFQKWIFLYQKSKLIFPFSVWRLIFLNQWQTWWGEMKIISADDWQITWPIFTVLTLFLILRFFMGNEKPDKVLLLILWILVYGAFLSLGVVSSRFLLPFLPITYVLGTYLISRFLRVRIRFK
ncbi:MAG: hypothetical protein ACOY0S_04115 [Patescibacteria group bacterium]